MSTEKNNKGLLDTLHKCLRCNKEAFEHTVGEFKCSDKNCNFEWKVITCGKKLL